jgi:hypothetical protein
VKGSDRWRDDMTTIPSFPVLRLGRYQWFTLGDAGQDE